jgi:hemerythrin-like domain-containing protein
MSKVDETVIVGSLDASRQAVGRLVREHDNIAQLLVVLDSQFAAIASGEDADDALIDDAMAYLTEFADRFHHAKEELAVEVVAARTASVRTLQPELNARHQLVRDAADALSSDVGRMLMDEPVRRQEFAATGFGYTSALRRSIEFEESSVFPRLIEGLDCDAWAQIDARLGSPLDPLFGPEVHERYRALFETLSRRMGID